MPTDADKTREVAQFIPIMGTWAVPSLSASAWLMSKDETITASAFPRTGKSSKNSARAATPAIG